MRVDVKRQRRRMDSTEFCRLHPVSQVNMVAKGEVMAGVMSVPDHEAPMRVCFWCGESIDILLFGDMTAKQKKEFERAIEANGQAPSLVVTDHEPCLDCAELMSRGVCIMEAEGKGTETKATGRFWVFTDAVVNVIISDPTVRDSILEKRRCLIDKDTARKLGFYDVEPPATLH
ncbi:hypothetical protein LCGC14_1805180 [marine sediment metagenome]|uniref:Uncharacterized protein n=1 Tax=marine sediment metagenome TaxID=412755 RepID=A0A0F9HBA8_9ZZZZ